MKKIFLSLLSFLSAVLLMGGAAQAACTLTVNNTNDSGGGSLRQALLDSNASAGTRDTICFNIPGSGLHTIQPTSLLPDITDPVEIDGYSQPGSSPNTLAKGTNAVLNIEIDGTNAGACCASPALTFINHSGSVVKGLVINRFQGDGVYLYTAQQTLVQGNFIGTDATGSQNLGNKGTGVAIVIGADDNVIGGTDPASRNLISGNSTDVQIGGAGGQGNTIQGNLIGTNATGEAGIGNPQGGGLVLFSSNNFIGGTDPGSGNVIAFNKFAGVAIVNNNPSDPTLNVPILGNSIFANGVLGINLALPNEADPGLTLNDPLDADEGPNHAQNFPDLKSATFTGGTLSVEGTLLSTPNQNFRVEFFASEACDTTGYGQGQTYLGFVSVMTDGGGTGEISTNFPVPPSVFITATATDADGNSSEFSKCLTMKPAELCDNGADDDGDGQADCSDSECAGTPACQAPAPDGGGCHLNPSIANSVSVLGLCLMGFLTLGLLIAAKRRRSF